jgi:Ca2+-binding RTX toxin-like protein
MSATLTIPVTNDTTVEAQEEIRLTLSNAQNAILGRSSVSAFITDGEEILANTTQKAILADNIFKDSKASINAYIKNKLDTSTVTVSGTSYTYSQVLVNNSVTTDVYAYLDSIIDDYEVLSETLISTIMTKADAYIDAQLSSFADYTAFATALTQLNSGIKGLNMGQIVGTNINSNGSFPSGQNATTLQTALDGKVDTLVTLAADTVADILGADTNTNFPNANVVMGTDGDDTITGTSGSDLIASFNGTDTVNSLAGNDKILGGAGVDTLNGGDDNDHLYGYAGADILNGNADADKILGGKDNDTINGGAGDDDLRGEAGDDTITTGAGSDTVSGGLGDDTIIIDAL